jgi:hypothetical protein
MVARQNGERLKAEPSREMGGQDKWGRVGTTRVGHGRDERRGETGRLVLRRRLRGVLVVELWRHGWCLGLLVVEAMLANTESQRQAGERNCACNSQGAWLPTATANACCGWCWRWHDGRWVHLEPTAAGDEGLARAEGTMVKPSIGSVGVVVCGCPTRWPDAAMSGAAADVTRFVQKRD